MIALGLACGAGSDDSARWARISDGVKNRQRYRCLFCGRRSASRRRLEIHHVRKIEHGGTNASKNLIALCHACHRGLVHRVEGLTFVSRLILVLQILGPRESRAVTWLCGVLFRTFLLPRPASAARPAPLPLSVTTATREAA